MLLSVLSGALYVSASVLGFTSKVFFWIILGPREVQISWFLVLLSMTHYILRLVFFRDQPTPPICLKMPECAKFSTFWESRFKHTPKVGVHRENLLMGNVAQIFFGAFYTCWDYVISFSQHFPMRKFSPSPSTSPSPESHLLLQNLQKFRKNLKNYFLKKLVAPQNIYQNICTRE